MRMTNLQRIVGAVYDRAFSTRLRNRAVTDRAYKTALRIAILVCLLACVRSQDVFAQSLNITTPSPLPDGVVGTPYSLTFTATGGGSLPRVWTLDSGSLPAGLSLAPTTGVLSGTPTAVGNPSFRIRVATLTDNDEMNFTLRISNPVSITTGSL